MEDIIKLIGGLLIDFYEDSVDDFAKYMNDYISYNILNDNTILIYDDNLDKMYFVEEQGKFLHMNIGSNVEFYSTFTDDNFKKILKRSKDDEWN